MRPMMGAPAQPKAPRGGVTTMVAGLLALVVAGLAVGGSFGDVSTYRHSFEIDGDVSTSGHSRTWWSFGLQTSDSNTRDPESILTGLTLVLAATLLVVGAVFAFAAARSRASGAVAGARSLITAGVGVLAGATLMHLIAVLDQMSTYNEKELEAGESLEFSAGLGLWLPLGGLVLGLVAIVLAHVGQRAGAVRVEPNTPRMGFPAPYGYRPQQMPVTERPTDVQPAGDDATTTQRVSGATASGTFAPVTPPAPVAPPAPITPATTSVPDTQTTAPASKPVLQPDAEKPTIAEPPAAPPATPVTEKPTDVEPPLASAGQAAPAAPVATTEPAPAAEPAATSPAAPASEPVPPSTPSPQTPTPPATSTEPAAATQPPHSAPVATTEPTPPVEPTTPPAGPASTPSPQTPTPPATSTEPEPAAPTSPGGPAGETAPPSTPHPQTAPPPAEPVSTPAVPGVPGERSALSDFPAAPPAPELSPEDDKNGK
ncbi:hypothetical protein [Actinophytocola sp. NPDC049390]|uniref:hypothetical protein n=1 Tax=Actinophytocola sp. NPDC049390 TaxID=3363894 RepID=UPI003796D399